MDTPFGIKFWGTRGQISSPRRETAKYGGSTTSMQVVGNDKLIAIDSGFGISNWGELLIEDILKHKKHLEIHILFTHFHWDHIQGLPFFHPIYFPQTKLYLHSPQPTDFMFDSLDILFDGSYSPFAGIKSMPSKIELVQMCDTLQLGSVSVDFQLLDHGHDQGSKHSQCYAYRFTQKEHAARLTVATDHETSDSQVNRDFVDFAKGSDLLVHDGQYSRGEYQQHQGWGHSTPEHAVANAEAIGAKQLLITHHAPYRDDHEIDAKKKELRQQHRNLDLQIDFAEEGKTYSIMKQAALQKKKKAG